MRGKLCVITGATSGIGRATALALGAMGVNLVLLGRNESKGRSVVARIARFPLAGKVEFLRTDLSVQRNVHDSAGNITRSHRHIDLLINNAGARFDHCQRSADGHELTFATNHLGHFLLTGLLLERLVGAGQGRIITVTSGSHGSARADGNWQLGAEDYDRRQAYAKSKLANLLFAYELARRLASTSAVSQAIDPGGVASHFARNNGWLSWAKHVLSHALRKELISSSEAAHTVVHVATAPDLPVANGGYYSRMNSVRSSPDSYDLEAARKLWALSLALTGLVKYQDIPCLFTKP